MKKVATRWREAPLLPGFHRGEEPSLSQVALQLWLLLRSRSSSQQGWLPCAHEQHLEGHQVGGPDPRSTESGPTHDTNAQKAFVSTSCSG